VNRQQHQKFALYKRSLLKNGCLKCEYCNAHVFPNIDRRSHQRATIDHVIPRSKGGKETLNNLKLSCLKCNKEKGNEIID